MKTTKFVSFALAGLVLATVGAQGVSAAEGDKGPVNGQAKDTTTTVTITDNSDPENPTDPIDPTDPTQKMLTLENVPSAYNFTTKLTDGNYTLTTGEVVGNDQYQTDLSKAIVVFNDRIDREWSVRANVTDNKIVRASDNTAYTV